MERIALGVSKSTLLFRRAQFSAKQVAESRECCTKRKIHHANCTPPRYECEFTLTIWGDFAKTYAASYTLLVVEHNCVPVDSGDLLKELFQKYLQQTDGGQLEPCKMVWSPESCSSFCERERESAPQQMPWRRAFSTHSHKHAQRAGFKHGWTLMSSPMPHRVLDRSNLFRSTWINILCL
eukprot:2401307-Amphidinium_carterae.1